MPVYSCFMLCHSIDPCWNRGSRSEDVYGSVEINHSRQWLSSRVYSCWCGKANAINHHKPIGKMFDMVRIPFIFGDFGDGLWMFMALGLPQYTMVEPSGTQSMKLSTAGNTRRWRWRSQGVVTKRRKWRGWTARGLRVHREKCAARFRRIRAAKNGEELPGYAGDLSQFDCFCPRPWIV